MNFIGKAIAAFRGMRGGTPVTGGWLQNNAPSGAIVVPGSSRPAENVTMVFGCLMVRREAIGSVPLMITDADDNALEAGPAFDLLTHPNPQNDWGQHVRQLETHMALHNVAAFHVDKDAAGRPLELNVLHPDGLTAVMGIHEPSGTPRVMQWQYLDPTTAVQREFEPADVVVHMGYNPHAPMATLSPTRVADRAIKSDIAAREQNIGVFVNDASPRGYLHTDQGSTKEQMKEVLSAWNSAYRGFANANKTAALWGGVKYDRIQFSPQELQFLDSLRQMRIDFYVIFRVYPAMMADLTGETGLSQGTSIESGRVAWWEDIGIPECTLIADMHQKVIDRMSGGRGMQNGRALRRTERISLSRKQRASTGKLYVWFNDMAVPALSRARHSKIDSLVKLSTVMGYPPDDASEYLDMGLPDHPDNLGRVAFSSQAIGDDVPEVTPVAPVVPGTQGTKETQGIEAETQTELASARCVCGSGHAQAALEKVTEILARAERDPARKHAGRKGAFDRLTRSLEKASAKRWSKLFIEQRGRVQERLAKGAPTVARAEGQTTADALMNKIFPRDVEDAALVARLTPLWSEHLGQGWKFFQETEGAGAKANEFQIADPDIQAAIELRKKAGLMANDTTYGGLKNVVAESIAAGETLEGMSDKIHEYFTDFVGENAGRPMTAARTETAGLVNEGRLLAAMDSGGTMLKGWLHGSPDEPRPEHLAAQAKYLNNPIPLDEDFEVGGEMMSAPGDASADIKNTANCTCMLVFSTGKT